MPYEQVKDAVSARVAAAAQDLRIAGARADSRLVRAAVARAQRLRRARRSPIRSRAIYLPYWTFDANADARWTAEAGHVLLRPRQSNQQVRQVRWTPASGQLSHVFDDELVCASVGVDAAQAARESNRFRPRRSCRSTPDISPAGRSSAIRSISSRRRSGRAQQMDAELRQLCGTAGARRHPPQSRRATPRSRDQTFKHILAPVWLMTYIYGAKSYQVVVNGVTGTIAGSRPWSWIKITLLVIIVLLIVVLFNANN